MLISASSQFPLAIPVGLCQLNETMVKIMMWLWPPFFYFLFTQITCRGSLAPWLTLYLLLLTSLNLSLLGFRTDNSMFGAGGS